VTLTPTPAMIDVLAPIWQRVLQRPFVSAEDDFFDLGGDPDSAVQLFNEIAKSCGRDLPALTIYQAPTVAALAALLERPMPSRFPTLVPMKAGSREPAIFTTHGLGGSVMEIFDLVREIQTDHPIYGLQSKGFDGKEEPLTRVEDIAVQYLEAMKELQSRGPYVLIGYSFGGLVMMEIAHRLRENEEEIALLEMLETYPHNNLLSLTRRLALFGERAKRHVQTLSQLPMRKRIGYLTNHHERVHASWNHGSESKPPETGLTEGRALDRYNHAGMLALMRYRPRFYKGKMNFVKAARVSSSFPDDPKAIWQGLAEEFEIVSATGDHFSMVTTQCQDLASVLTRHLAAAFSEE
jgi:thioesterase domain-containing protein